MDLEMEVFDTKSGYEKLFKCAVTGTPFEQEWSRQARTNSPKLFLLVG